MFGAADDDSFPKPEGIVLRAVVFRHRYNFGTCSHRTLGLNQLTIIGFTGQDAEFHYTPNRIPVATFSVATKESWKSEQGEWQSRTERHRVVSFGKLGEYAKTLVKGSHLLVQGALRSREYEKDGMKHRVVQLRADSIGKLDRALRREDGEPRSEDA